MLVASLSSFVPPFPHYRFETADCAMISTEGTASDIRIYSNQISDVRGYDLSFVFFINSYLRADCLKVGLLLS